MSSFSIAVTGDSLLSNRIPRTDKKMIELKEVLEEFEVRFTNFEMLVHDFETFPAAESGGTFTGARPIVLQDLNWLGFNMYSLSNNHSLDWDHEGLQICMRHMREQNSVFSGAGNNLAEASEPAYLDLPGGRVALISICSTAHPWNMAGEQRPDLRGRPGINMLRVNTVHHVSQSDLDALKRITAQTEINAHRDHLIREGFEQETSGFAMDKIRFEAGDQGTVTTCNQEDLERVGRYISEAKRQADVVLLSHHFHQFKGHGPDKSPLPDFGIEFAHFCIDNGVHAFLGHGPHVIRAVETYKNRPIIYGLGDFYVQNESVERQPSQQYDLFNLGPNNTPADAFDARSGHGTRGWAVNRGSFETVIATFTVQDDMIPQVEFIPVSMNFAAKRPKRGRPELASPEDAQRILETLQKLSAPYNSKIEIKNGRGLLKIL